MKYLFFLVLASFYFTPANAAFPGTDSTAVAVRRTASAEKLAAVVRFKTISAVDSANFKYDEFKNLHVYLSEAFPLVHRHLKVEIINSHSLLYTWQGNKEQLKPVLFSAHMDVVPVESGAESAWEEQPFTGELKDGFVWGRGTMDDKYRVIAILEAAERLLEEGYTPTRTLYFAFGHDEEVGGEEGAGMISKHLQGQGVMLEAVFDEGLAIAEGVVPGIEVPLALVGTAAKGNLNLRLTVQGVGGHSSAPPKETSINILSRSIQRLQENPFKARMIPTTRETLETLAGKMGGKYKFALRHYGLFKGKILKKLSEDRATDVLIRTKMVPTVIAAGEKSNVLPKKATALINVRILNGENEQTVMQHVRKAIKDNRVKIERYGIYTPPSPVTATNTWIYDALKTSILEIFPDVMVVPALFPGATDARHYESMTNNIFRFAPQVVDRESAQLIHNANERMAVEVLENSISFYDTLIRNTCGRQAQVQFVDVEATMLPADSGGE